MNRYFKVRSLRFLEGYAACLQLLPVIWVRIPAIVISGSGCILVTRSGHHDRSLSRPLCQA